jgi:hypothetical protein
MEAEVLVAPARELKYILEMYMKGKDVLRINQSYIVRVIELGDFLVHMEVLDPKTYLPTYGHVHLPLSNIGEIMRLEKDNQGNQEVAIRNQLNKLLENDK